MITCSSDSCDCSRETIAIHVLWPLLLLSLIANGVLLWKVFSVPVVGGTPAPCQSEPCLNGGLCLEDEEDYSCSCREGFIGTNCEIDPSKHQTCISCSSETDVTCTEDQAPSSVVLCDGGTCYVAKDADTNVISRGCYSAETMSDNRMLHPESGQFICSSYPPGVAGIYTCVCDGSNCNNNTNTYSAMGGPDLEKASPYERTFNCKCPTCSVLCYMDKSMTVRGCSCSSCGTCN